MDKSERIELICQSGIIAILRAHESERLLAAAAAIQRGGIRAIEVTLNTPDALSLIEQAPRELGPEVLFGAGTVLNPESAQAAIRAGADFIVTPTLNPQVIAVCRQHQVPIIPGCFTPTEMLTAWESGADLVKLFPAELGGPGLVKAILAPLPQLRVVPVGGVDLHNAAEFIRSGASALGVGSSLVNQKVLGAGDWDELARRSAAFIEQVKLARDHAREGDYR